MFSTNEKKLIKIENIDFENDLVFLHYKNDIFIGCRCVLYDATDIYKYVFYSQYSNKLDNIFLAIEFSPTYPRENERYVIRKYQ